MLFLIFFLITELASTKFVDGPARLFIQILFSLLSVIFFFVQLDLGILEIISTAFYDRVLIVSTLLTFAVVRLYSVFVTNDKPPHRLELPLLVLTVMATPLPVVKILFLVGALCLSLKRVSSSQFTLDLSKLVCLGVSTFYLMQFPDILGLHLFVYFVFIFSFFSIRSLPFLLLVNSVSLELGSIPGWASWFGLSLVFIRVFFFILVQNQILDIIRLNLNKAPYVQRVVNYYAFKREWSLGFYSNTDSHEFSKSSFPALANKRDYQIIEIVFLWSIICLFGVLAGGYL